MEHELWNRLSHAMFDVARAFPKSPRQTFETHTIVRVYLWAVLHDRPVSWATQATHWDAIRRPKRLPIQSTMSRRLRCSETWAFLSKLALRVGGSQRACLLKSVDGKALVVPKHSTDPDAAYGRGVGGFAKGYKLHAIWGDGGMPLAWSVQPLNVQEIKVTEELIPQLACPGYLLADANYDSNPLYDHAGKYGHQLLAPRQQPGKGLGHHYHSPYRRRAIDLLEKAPSEFGRSLYRRRREIERQFGGLVSFGGGLQSLPSWVRTLPRVRLFVHAKLIINATRLRRLVA